MSTRLDALLLVLAALALAPLPNSAQAQGTPVDLELVLAVDVSLSMDEDEQRLQRQGYVAAFRHADVVRAIRSGIHGRIAVAFIEWAGDDVQRLIVPWTLVDGTGSAGAFADALERAPITGRRRTSISGALLYGAGLLESNGYAGLRRVIDVSGDGPNNMGPPVAATRDQVTASGIIINGLPIVLKLGDPAGFHQVGDLDFYYKDCVIGGPGAFLIGVRDAREFPEAIRKKLILEIAGTMPRVIRAQAKAPREPTDCLIGEKIWDTLWD
ncbi:MAG: DUF1194 domain-containing protein [Methyloligellaceae bacterium]